jgi:hypothetical protein
VFWTKSAKLFASGSIATILAVGYVIAKNAVLAPIFAPASTMSGRLPWMLRRRTNSKSSAFRRKCSVE